MPPFGSWVKAEDEESKNQIYGVVYYATTSPIDSVHRARALGLSAGRVAGRTTADFCDAQKPSFEWQLWGLRLRRKGSTVTARREVKFISICPPRPPQIHQAVYRCEPDEVIDFTVQLDFLRTLLGVANAPVDALTAAAIREIYQLRMRDRSWLVEAGRSLSVLLKDDYDRLRVILSQIHP